MLEQLVDAWDSRSPFKKDCCSDAWLAPVQKRTPLGMQGMTFLLAENQPIVQNELIFFYYEYYLYC
uniref:Uncharacterized protein n=1 Tax=Anguilla anguilla TaxID=7936 RepID=A0A0E9WLY0_ANGAN